MQSTETQTQLLPLCPGRVQIERLTAVAGWVSWLEHRPIHQEAVGLIPGQGTYLGCRFDPWLGIYERQPISFSLTLMFLSLSLSLSIPLSLKISKHILGEERKKGRKKGRTLTNSPSRHTRHASSTEGLAKAGGVPQLLHLVILFPGTVGCRAGENILCRSAQQPLCSART